MFRSKLIRESARLLAERLENRSLLSAYLPAIVYPFAVATTVQTIFASGSGNLTFVDGGGISTQSGGAAPVLRAPFLVDGIDDPLGSAFEDSSGDIFGTTKQGGTDTQPSGAVWELKAGSTSLTLLASFDSTTVGNQPTADFMDASGNIYGTTALGANGVAPGSIWEYHASTQLISHVAIPALYASVGIAIVADSAGDIFGATSGSTASPGLFFEIPAGGNVVDALATFSSSQQGNNGGLAIDSGGNIYGTTEGGNGGVNGGGNEGGLEIFKVSPGNLTALVPLGTIPASTGSLLLDASGDIFSHGETIDGSTTTETFYELPANQHVAESIATLDNDTVGFDTLAFTLDTTNGVIYGVTQDGGSSGNGTIFSLVPGGSSGGSANLTTSITRSTLPTSVVAGGTSKGVVTIEVTNTSSAVDTGVFSGVIFASTDGLLDSTAVKLGSVARHLSIKAGQTKSVTVQVKSVPTGMSGTYTLLSNVIDGSGNNVSSDTGPILNCAGSLQIVFRYDHPQHAAACGCQRAENHGNRWDQNRQQWEHCQQRQKHHRDLRICRWHCCGWHSHSKR